MLLLAEMCLSVSVYMQLPLLAQRSEAEDLGNMVNPAVASLSCGVGLWAFGPFCNWLSQRYRRNSVFTVSTMGMLAMLMFVALLYRNNGMIATGGVLLAVLSYFLLGAFYGLSKRLLTGILMIDKTETFNRNEANANAVWCSFVSMPIALLLAIIVVRYYGAFYVCILGVMMTALAVLLVAFVKFPFKAPTDVVGVFSTDRFVLWQNQEAFFVLSVVSFAVGTEIGECHDLWSYAMLLSGFVVAMLTENTLGSNHGAWQETRFGLLIFCLSAFGLFFVKSHNLFSLLCALLAGMAIGYVGLGVLRHTLGASHHCQRGTVMSSFFLAVEFWMAMGICVDYAMPEWRSVWWINIPLFASLVALAVCNEMHEREQMVGKKGNND